MIKFLLKTIRSLNGFFLLFILILQGVGLLCIYSASYERLYLFKQQMIWILLSWLVFLILSQIKSSFISKTLWPLFWIHILALFLVSFMGKEVYNSKRWLDLGFFNYQPSETLKWVLLLLTSKKIAQKPFGEPFDFMSLIPFFVFIMPPLLLVLLQPDLGTAGILFIMTGCLVLFQGLEKKTLLSFSILFIASLPLIWNFVLKPYQKSRVVSFIKPEKDPQGSGYNVIQSKIAIGSGQVFGKGFKQGTQNKLQFLPERHTDFIFSVLSEEYGFLGSSFILSLFLLMICYIFNLARMTRDRLSCYFCLSAGFFLLWHTLLNLAMTMGLFPVVGIPLPLLSYGGSHLLTTMAFLGICAGVHKDKDIF